MNRTVLTLVFFFISALINSLSAQTSESAESPFWLWTFLGRLHPLIVHFPIGLLLVAVFLELLSLKNKSQAYAPAISILVYTGTISSVLAVVFGLLLSKSDDYGGDLLPIHQWTGIGTMLFALLTSFAYLRLSKQLQKILLILTVAGVVVGGHYGALMTHGEDYLTSAFPSSEEESSAPGMETAFILTRQSGTLNDVQVQLLNLQVRTIIAHNCTNCHGEAKSKGELRLDSKEAIFKGGENGPILVPGNPESSEMFRRITLPKSHKEVMPSKGKLLTKQEIDIIEYWIKKGAQWPEGELKSIYRVAALEPRMPVLPSASGDMNSPVDLFVDQYFAKNKIKWSETVDDRTYIRRVYLDITGLIPAVDSIDAFIKDSRLNKREILVQNLLNRDNDYAQHWLTFWNDALRNDYSGTGYITGGRFDITKWLYTSLKENKPYNLFVKELISPTKESKGFIKGITWRGTINASQKTEMQAAQNVAQVFLGLNLKCASCHDSFISDWKLEDAYAFASIFSDSTLEINRCDKPTGKMAGTGVLFKQLGDIDSNRLSSEKMKQLAEYLVQPKDGRLYRTLVNRVWAQMMGRGIVEPVDEMDREPWSQDLLDWLASDFVSSGYDIKQLIYKIATSKTYQLPSVGIKEPELIVAQDYVFKGMLRRRMTAEQFTDAVSKSLETVYGDSAIVYKLLPKDIKHAIPFPRAALVQNDAFLTALGRPNRETVSTNRTSQANLLQALELTNGNTFNQAVKRAAVKWKEGYTQTEKLVTDIYRNTLGRMPSKEEVEVARKIMGEVPDIAAIEDFIWSVTLHPEFQLIF